MTDPTQDPGDGGGMTYSLKAVLDKNPIQVSGAVVGVVNFLILMHWLVMTGVQVGGLNTVLVLILGLFVTSKVDNKRTRLELEALAQQDPAPPA